MLTVGDDVDVLKRFVRAYPKALPDELVEALIAVPVPETSRIDHDWRRCSLTPIKGGPLDDFKRIVRRLLDDYRRGVKTLNACTRIERPGVLRYEPRTDGPPDHFHEHADSWHIGTATRQISVVGYLNDVDEGGETVFPHWGIAQRPTRGTVLLFPASFAFSHLARPPVSNTKIAIVTWLHFATEGSTPHTEPLDA